MTRKLSALDERVLRADHHVSAAAHDHQNPEQILAETLADMRAWCATYGVSFGLGVDQSFPRYIHDRVNK